MSEQTLCLTGISEQNIELKGDTNHLILFYVLTKNSTTVVCCRVHSTECVREIPLKEKKYDG